MFSLPSSPPPPPLLSFLSFRPLDSDLLFSSLSLSDDLEITPNHPPAAAADARFRVVSLSLSPSFALTSRVHRAFSRLTRFRSRLGKSERIELKRELPFSSCETTCAFRHREDSQNSARQSSRCGRGTLFLFVLSLATNRLILPYRIKEGCVKYREIFYHTVSVYRQRIFIVALNQQRPVTW